MDTIYSIENFEDGDRINQINSPRSLEACLKLGLDPMDIMPKHKSFFNKGGFTKDMVDMKYEYFERKRRDRINLVREERSSIIKNGNLKSTRTLSPLKHNTHDSLFEQTQRDRASKLLEMEEKRLDALKRRQEKELARIIDKENGLAELQQKIQRGEKEELLRRRDHDKKVAAQRLEDEKKVIMRQQELKKLEEDELKRRRDIARKENAFERKMKTIRKEEEKRIIKEARQRDLERIRVIEENQRKTEEMIEIQLKRAEEARKVLIEREKRVQDQLEAKKNAKAVELLEKREKAALRIQQALLVHHKIQVDKKVKFDSKQADANERNKQKLTAEKEILKKQQEDREKLERDRIKRLIDSYKSRSQNRKAILKRMHDKDHGYETIKADMDKRVQKVKFDTTLKMEDKLENVERISRMKEYHRLELLKRIEMDDVHFERMQIEKEELQRKHQLELKSSLVRKHEISDAMEQMKVTNDFSLLNKLLVPKKNNGRQYDEDDNRATTA